LARLFVSRARLWLLDEPFTALDQAAIQAVAGLIEAHAKSGGSALYTSHHHVSVAGARRLELTPPARH
jgi:heme exporter protein A